MPFSIASGPEEYQRRQREFLNGLRGVINIADDICVYGGATQRKTLTSTTTETWCSSWRNVLNTIYGSLRKNFSSNPHLSLSLGTNLPLRGGARSCQSCRHQRNACSSRQSGSATLPGNVPIPVQILS